MSVQIFLQFLITIFINFSLQILSSTSTTSTNISCGSLLQGVAVASVEDTDNMFQLLEVAQYPQLLYPYPGKNSLLLQALPFASPQNIKIKQQVQSNSNMHYRNDQQKIKQYEIHSFSFPTNDGTNCFGISARTYRYSNGYAIESYIFLIFSCPVEKYFQNYLQFKLQQMEKTGQQLINLTKQIWEQISNLQLPLQFQYNEQSMSISQLNSQNYEIKIQEPLPQLQQFKMRGRDISEIMSALLSEQKVIITGENREEITNFIEQILLILNPFTYPGLYYYILPEKYLHVVQIPFQIFCGIEMQLLLKTIVQPETLIYNITEQQFLTAQQLEEKQISMRYVLPRQVIAQKNFKLELIYEKDQSEEDDVILLNTNQFDKIDNFIPENVDVYLQYEVKKFFKIYQQKQKVLLEKVPYNRDEEHIHKDVDYLRLLCPNFYNDQYFIKMIQFNERIYYSATGGFVSLENSSKSSQYRKTPKIIKNRAFLFDSSDKLFSESTQSTETPISISGKIQQLQALYYGIKENKEEDTVINQLPQLIKDTFAAIFDQSEETDIIPHPYAFIVYYMNELIKNNQMEKFKQEQIRLQKANIVGQSFLAFGSQQHGITDQQLSIVQQMCGQESNIRQINLQIGLQLALLQLVQVYRKYLRANVIQQQPLQVQRKQKPTYECIMSPNIKCSHQQEIIKEINKRIQQKVKQIQQAKNNSQQLTDEQIDVLVHEQQHKIYDKIIDTRAFIEGSLPLLQPFLEHFTKSIWWESFLETNLSQQINEEQFIFNSFCKNSLTSSQNQIQCSPSSTNYGNSITPFSLLSITKQQHIKEPSSSSTDKNESTFVYNENDDDERCELFYYSLDKDQKKDIISTYYYLFGPYQPLRYQKTIDKDSGDQKIELNMQCYKQTEKQDVWHKRDFQFTKVYEVVSVSWWIDKYKEKHGELILDCNSWIYIPEITKDMPTQYCVSIYGRKHGSDINKELKICFQNKYDIYKFLQIAGGGQSNQMDRLRPNLITKMMQNRRKARLMAIGAIQEALEKIQNNNQFLQWIYLQKDM